jgi:hypothetical protein
MLPPGKTQRADRPRSTRNPFPTSIHDLSSCRHDGRDLEIVCRCGAILRVTCPSTEAAILGAIEFALGEMPHESPIAVAIAS